MISRFFGTAVAFVVCSVLATGCAENACDWTQVDFAFTPEQMPQGMTRGDCIALVAPDGTGFHDLDSFTCTDEDPYECVIVSPERVAEVGFFVDAEWGNATRPMLVPRAVECKRYECAELRDMISASQ